jgi:hypothetical protein
MVQEQHVELPNTDNADVMQQAVSIFLMHMVWEEYSRIIDPEKIEEKALELYDRIYTKVDKIHGN